MQKPPSFLSLSFESGLDGNGNITLQSTWWFYPSASFPPFSVFSRHLHRAWFIFKPTRWFFRFFMTLVFFFTFAWFLSSFLSHPCSSHRLPQTTMTTIKLDSSSGAWVSTVVDSLARFIPLWDDNFFAVISEMLSTVHPRQSGVDWTVSYSPDAAMSFDVTVKNGMRLKHSVSFCQFR